MIHFACPNCHKKLKANVHEALPTKRWRARCSRCLQLVEIPKSVGALRVAESGFDLGEPAEIVEYSEAVELPLGNARSAPAQVPDLYPEWGHAEQRTRGLMLVISALAALMVVLIVVGWLLLSSNGKKQVAQGFAPPTTQKPKQKTPTTKGSNPDGARKDSKKDEERSREAKSEPDNLPRNDPESKPNDSNNKPMPPADKQSEPSETQEKKPAVEPKDEKKQNAPNDNANPAPKNGGNNNPAPKKRGNDLPNVEFQIPEGDPPAVKSIIRQHAPTLLSKTAPPQAKEKAAEVLGELREHGKSIRNVLCYGMRDPDKGVRIACADALYKVDKKMQFLAVGIETVFPPIAVEKRIKYRQLLSDIQRLEDDAYPLSALIAHHAILGNKDLELLGWQLTTLSHIAKGDRNAFVMLYARLDPPNNARLDPPNNESLRLAVIEGLGRMRHGAVAAPKLIAMLPRDTATNRVAIIKTLVQLADKTTHDEITKAIRKERYHENEAVRRAVEEAVNKLENRKDY